MALLKNKIDIDDYFIGRVLEIDRTTREVSVYIPQLMPAIPSENPQVSEVQTTTNTRISGLDYNETIVIRNSIWTRPRDYDNPLPKVGSQVMVWIMDGNPRLAFWTRFNPNNNYEVIDEEKYASLFKLRMNLQDIDIFEEDTIVFNLPDNTTIAYNTEEKTKTINFKQSENYIVSEIIPSTPFEGLLWYEPISKELKLYNNGSFRKMLTENEVNSLISDLNDTIAALDARVTALETP